MAIPILTDIINNFWFFQTEGIVPFFKELPLSPIIIILMVASIVLPFVLDQLLFKSKYHVPIGLVLFPILVVLFTYAFINFGNLLGFDFYSFDFNKLIDTIINHWWIFFLFWPVVGFQLIMRLFIKGENAGKIITSIPIPIFEELAFRVLCINTIYLLSQSIVISIILSSIAFAIIHLPNKSNDKWGGPVKINAVFISGFIWGIVAIQYGVIFSIIIHVILNSVGVFVMPKLIPE
ncbi:MAG: CPBP family glutamic-type intramembrane protease [Nanoarchaeota archaeon]|nr:CPBP family intramembrane metalloprotease [Nanoarchaeota archaeon]MBU1632242.1 CPBP family intramembrane metalloprotease [Nanoarchaeota archaeon]MBU1876430.1 CPBP family intramembrane metalloprotease [Nanoarchaeota archaeon]